MKAQPLFQDETVTPTLQQPWEVQNHAVQSLREVLPDLHEPEPPTAAQQAESEAFRRGLEAGAQQTRAQTEAMLQRFQKSLDALVEARHSVLAASHDNMVQLCVHVATQLVMADMRGRTELAARMVAQCTTLLESADRITVRMAPMDLVVLRAERPELFDRAGLHIVEDEKLQSGDVRAESALGNVDATLQSRIQTMAQQMLGEAK